MAHTFTNEALGCSFSLPDPFTLGDYERYEMAGINATAGGSVTNLSLWWAKAVAIVKDWQCPALSEATINKAEISERQLAIIAWVGLTVRNFIAGLMEPPKN